MGLLISKSENTLPPQFDQVFLNHVCIHQFGSCTQNRSGKKKKKMEISLGETPEK